MQIHVHARQGNIAGVKQQLAIGVDIDCLDKYPSQTPLMCAVSSPKAGVDMVRYLVDNGANVNEVDEESGHPVLSLAVQSGNLQKIQFLLEAGADIHYQSDHGYDVLSDAMSGEDIRNNQDLIPILKLLLERGAPVGGVSSYGGSALRTAS